MTLQVLVIEDDPQVADFLAEVLSGPRCRVTCARTLAEGLALVSAQPCDLVFLDVWLPDGVGLDAVRHIRHSGTRPEVVIMTGRGDPSGAALALELGAWDYVYKPLSVDEMRLIAARVMDYRHSALSFSPSVLNIKDFVSFSPAMADCLRLAARAAATDVPVLILGETGTGKERVARGIHDHSARASMPFVVVDCTVIPESLVESHLFGHERGTFTGADRRRIGLVQLAHQGTLFLDEVGDLPLLAQGKLLRVVQEKTFRPIGAKGELFSDFRLMAATHRSLEDMVARGRFREDLYYRLAGLTLTVPPLRHRKEDIVPLVQEVLRREARRTRGELKGLSTDFLETVHQYPWPGNVRELMQATLHALAVSGEGPTLYAAHLPTS
ncbi:sigma-54-dependent transcriptional regulator, partial [Desulfosoma sp.]|uniref:sigma-54-dependent transcriptional regulator n=1 Tax=Desulfosoma sp. TaxID=2603217 RepID=UPI0040496079